jgi:hypothetical protein
MPHDDRTFGWSLRATLCGSLALTSAVAMAGSAQAQNFVATGSLHIARTNHHATLLLDGRVLVSGGRDGTAASIAAAEIFDPATGTWTVSGSNLTPRQEHAATRLLDGRLMVVGGVHHYFACSSNASAETFNPATGTWSLTGSLPAVVGTGAIAVTLADGRVLVTGGGNRCGSVFASAALFNPATNTWSATTPMSIPREFHSGVLLADGRVLVAGGATSSPFNYQTSTEIFDPATGSWSIAGGMATSRATACGAHVQSFLGALPDGNVVAAGAYTGSCSSGAFPTAATEVFDVSTSTWSSAAAMSSPRGGTTVTTLASGELLIAGGFDGTVDLATAELFDGVTATWMTTGSLLTPRSGHSATLLLDGRVLIAAGQQSTLLNTAELYSPGPTADTIPPQVSCGAGDGAWHSSDISLTCTATDDESGLADAADAEFLLTTSIAAGTETANAFTGSRSVCDVSGNCADAGPIGSNKIDKRPPTIDIQTPVNGTYSLGQTVTADYSCQDSGSGVATCQGPVASGAALTTPNVGTSTFVVTSSDGVGNTESASVSYTVGYNVCVLYDPNKAHRIGSTIPIKLQLCDAAGTNVSSSTTTLVLTGVTLVSTNANGQIEDSGNANPDSTFRFDATLSGGGYIFNLSLKGFSIGTYSLSFQASGEPTVHQVYFQVK